MLKTPLYDQHRASGARLVPFAGYELPIQYQGIVEEHRAVRERAGLFDVSHMGELELEGPGALATAAELITNDLEKASDGQAVYTCACNESGTILDDLIVYRSNAERILVVCNASNRQKMVEHVRRAAEGRCRFHDASDETALLALQGPRALDVLAALSPSFDAKALAPFRFRAGTVAGIGCTVARTGYTGEDGVELFVASERAAELWQALLDAGKPHGLVPVGLGARDTLRLEARLALYGNDIDETTTPYEAGLGWTVKLDKAKFLGREALAKQQAEGVTRQLAGFEMIGRGVARHGYPLLDEAKNPVGVCTSGSPSPTLGKNIGLGYLPVSLSATGTRFLVDCRGKPVEAVVVRTPFYRRAKKA